MAVHQRPANARLQYTSQMRVVKHIACRESKITLLQRPFRLYVPFLGIARPQPQFPHACVFERFIYSQDQSTCFLQQNRQTHRGNISFAHRHMNVEIGTEAPIFLFWEYLFQIFGILSLQCRTKAYRQSVSPNCATNFISQPVFTFTGRNRFISMETSGETKIFQNHPPRLFRPMSIHTCNK